MTTAEVAAVAGHNSRGAFPSSLFGKVRDAVLLALGAGGFVYEAILAPAPRSILIGAYLLMLGVPAFNGVDRLFQRPGGSEPAATQDGGEQQ